MNIMIVSPIVSHPPISGARMKINKLTAYLKKLGHNITFVHYNIEGTGIKAQIQMEEAWDKYIQIPKTKIFEKSYDIEYGIDDWYEDLVTDTVLKECKNNSFDVIITNYVFMTKFFEKLPQEILKIVDTHDILSDRLQIYQQNGIEAGFFYTSKNEEKIGLDRADIVFAIQDIEAAYFQKNTKARVITINHLEDKHFLNKKYKRLKKIGYLAANNKFNIKSIEVFLNEFKKYKNFNIELYIAGNICNVLKVRDSRIKLVGFLEDVDKFYKDIDLIINPTLVGTGLKIKSIEALSFGVPVISTKIGFDGINSSLREHNLANSQDMIETIENIYKNPEKLNFLADYCKEIFEKYLESTQFKLFKLFPPTDFKKVEKNYVAKEQIKIFDSLLVSLEKLSSVSFIKSPLKKLQAYKDVLKEYNQIK